MSTPTRCSSGAKLFCLHRAERCTSVQTAMEAAASGSQLPMTKEPLLALHPWSQPPTMRSDGRHTLPWSKG
jgi:hypothetical protein